LQQTYSHFISVRPTEAEITAYSSEVDGDKVHCRGESTTRYRGVMQDMRAAENTLTLQSATSSTPEDNATVKPSTL
jgi:hypothetical protein